MRTVLDIFGQIFRNLWAHKLRSFLTMFGIAWGVGSLLLLVGVGEGFRSGNKREMAEFGKDIMFIFPGRAPAVKGNMNSARSYLLTYQDYLDIRRAPHVRNAAPLISREDLHEVSEFANGSGEILGTEPQLNEISYLPLKEGRWLNQLDGEQRRNVIVLGYELQNVVPRPSRGRVIRPDQRFEV
jgi:putative ABC transport system permease protein